MDIDAVLRQADPMAQAVVTPLSPDTLRVMKELTMEASTYSPDLLVRSPSRNRRSRRRMIAIAAAITAVGVAVPVAALTGGIHTGFFPGRNDTELTQGEELLNLSDPAIVEVVRAEAADVPLPEGVTFADVLARYPIAEPTLAQRSGIRTELEFFAQCRWYADWLGADAAGRARDAKVIATFVDWQFMRAFAPGDPGPQITRDLVAQVQRGEENLLRQFMAANC